MVLFAGKLYKQVSLFTLSFVLAISGLVVAVPLYFSQIAHAAAPVLTLTVQAATTITQSTLVAETNGTASDAAVSAAISGHDAIPVTLQNTGDADSVNVRISPIVADSHIQLWAKDTSNSWYDINVTGYIDSAGMAVPKGYSITTNVFAISDTAGTYTLTANLVDVTNPLLPVPITGATATGTVTVTPVIYTRTDFRAFDGVSIGTNSYTVSNNITTTYNSGTGTINDPVKLALTGYAPIVTPWFNSEWKTYNYVAIGIELPAGFFGTSVYSADVMRYDDLSLPDGYYTENYGSTPLATTGDAFGYLNYEFAASSINTKNSDGIVKLKVIWTENSAPEYFTIDVSGLQLGPDTIPPTATATHDETLKTITYTFSEPVQLRDTDGVTGLDSSLYASSLAVYEKNAYLTHALGIEPAHVVTISSAVLSSDAKSIVITYTGSLIKNADASYVVDAWGKNITDLAGNKMAQDASQIFNVTGDAIAPVVEITAPAAGSSLSGTVAIRGTVTDANPDHYYLVIQDSSNAVIASPNTVYDSTSFSDKSLFTWNTKLVPDGVYTIRLEARDAANNKDNSISVDTKSVTVDNKPPVITIDSYNTGWTNGNINVTASTNEGTLNATSHQFTENDSFTFVATDSAGNSSSQIVTINNIDKIAPTATYKHYIDDTEFTGSIAYVNNINKLSFTGEYADATPSSGLLKDSYVIFDAQSDHSFNFSQNGAKSYCGWRTEPNLVDLSGNSFSLTTKESFARCVSTLGEGEYYMTHQVYDNAVRSDIPSITQYRDVLGLHFVIDNTAPTVNLAFPTPNGFQAIFSEDVNLADATNPANYFLTNWPGAGGSGDLVDDATITYDKATHVATVTFTNPGWYISPEQQWSVQDIHDLAGNIQSANSYSQYSTPMVKPITTDSGTDDNWHNTDVTVILTCDDDSLAIGSGCKTTYYTTDGSDPTTASSQGNSVVVSAEGITMIKYFSVDNAGNEGIVKTAANTIKIDKINPTVALDAITSPTGGTTNNVDITGTVSDANITSYQLTVANSINNIKNDTGVLTTTGGAITTYPWDILSLPSGTYTVTLTATDAAGNTNSATQSVVVDNSAPDVSIIPLSTTGNQPTFTGLVDNSATKLTVTVDGVALTVTRAGTTWSASVTSPLADGSHTVKAIAVDALDNRMTVTQPITVTTTVIIPATQTTPASTVTTTATTGEPVIATDDSGAGVLGAQTTKGNTDNTTTPAKTTASILGDTTAKDNSSIWGLAWYWWLVILAAAAAIIWWIVAAMRSRDNQNA